MTNPFLLTRARTKKPTRSIDVQREEEKATRVLSRILLVKNRIVLSVSLLSSVSIKRTIDGVLL